MSSYWNTEDDDKIICPYCGEIYEPSYDYTYIGEKTVDCYTEDTETYTIRDLETKEELIKVYQALTELGESEKEPIPEIGFAAIEKRRNKD